MQTACGASPKSIRSRFWAWKPGLSPLCAKREFIRAANYQLSSRRSIGCTGAAIPLAAYPVWVRGRSRRERAVAFRSSGGTDVARPASSGDVRIVPVYPGESSVRCLGLRSRPGMNSGKSVVDGVGELVYHPADAVDAVYFWADPDGRPLSRTATSITYPGNLATRRTG